MELGGFIGRFHPLVVHLPIGLLIAAAVFEYLARKRRYQQLDTAVEWSLFLGAAFAIVSCVSGWLLANRGAYLEQSLFLHRWLGIAVAVLSSLAWLVKSGHLALSKRALTGLIGTMVLGLFAAGHFGGNMTHGEDYLVEYAPDFVKNLFGAKAQTQQAPSFGPPDSIEVYADLVKPVLQDRCWKCHRSDNAQGGLDMSTKTTFLKGGDNGHVLEAGVAYESELFQRITLPANNRKSMPPIGLALPYHQIRLVEWWIDSGASFEKTLVDLEVPDDMQKLLSDKYHISFKKPRAIDRIEVAAADETVLEAIRKAGFRVEPLAETSNLLEVSASDEFDLQALLPIKDQITWLNLAEANLEDSQIRMIAEFPHVTRLRLQGNPVTDRSVAALAQLYYLESLNLNQTAITDQSLETLKEIPNLRSVFLFQTNLSEEAVNALQTARPDLEVVRGFRFEANKLE